MNSNSLTFSNDNLRSRLASEKRFKFYGIIAIILALSFVLILFTNIISKGYSAFYRTLISIDINLSEGFDVSELSVMTDKEIYVLDFYSFTKKSIYKNFPQLEKKSDKKQAIKLFSIEFEDDIKNFIIKNKNDLKNKNSVYLVASDDIDQIHKGHYSREIPEERRRVSDFQLSLYDELVIKNKVKYEFNFPFFIRGDSREPELAGLGGSLIGSFYTMIIVLLLSFPFGLFGAIYLEEFSKKNKFTDFIEININNLAAVPSIVFGLLGLGILLNTFEMPRSTALVGGITLSLMTLPTIIIATRASLRSVPPSIREGALAVGASKVQTIMHHVVPLALPGSVTGTIIGIARALGETAPLLLIGMVAFIVDVPSSPVDPSTSLPVQAYLWHDSAERAYEEKTSAAIMLLLSFLIIFNLFAVLIRRKFETKW
tara:strand:- start:2032 stop:3315 length:1284 start_codon:yes stop_codon:yes gene_type:complete